ncbi:MAG: transcriptional regulator [Marinilabiliales bacterium]|nr:MAG: transcriptional regulator [Marinilabiliales bacterium]
MTKTEIDIRKLETTAQRLRSVAHPMRIQIIRLLEKKDEMNVTNIYQSLGIEQASASHHLNILKSNSILESRRDGKNTYYSLKSGAIIELINCINKCGKQ